jgi:hypothetical protein
MRIDCGRLDPGAVIRPERGEWHPACLSGSTRRSLADWRAGRNAIYQLAALTAGGAFSGHGNLLTYLGAGPSSHSHDRTDAYIGCLAIHLISDTGDVVV